MALLRVTGEVSVVLPSGRLIDTVPTAWPATAGAVIFCRLTLGVIGWLTQDVTLKSLATTASTLALDHGTLYCPTCSPA